MTEEIIIEEEIIEEIIPEESNIEDIIMPIGTKYLGDSKSNFKEIPANCILNKGMTGCGGTELAIRNKVNTIIAMPFINLVKNKQAGHPQSLLGIHGGVSKDVIIEYIKTHEILKFAIVYDSLDRLIRILDELEIDTKPIFLLVDEWHTLMDAYEYRKTGINRLIENAKRFDNVTYMSATPIEEEFILEELKNYKICNIIWQEKKPVSIMVSQTNDVLAYAKQLIIEYLNKNTAINIHLFINSVKLISKIVNELELDPSTVKIVCSKSSGKNQITIGAKYPIEEITLQVKKINLYTSAAFEGCDIYDKDGVTFILSDGNKQNMQTNLRTQFVQICGRIRNSRYNNQVRYIFKKNLNKNKTKYVDYKSELSKSVDNGKDYCKQFNRNSESFRKITISHSDFSDNNYCVTGNNSTLSIDMNQVKADLMQYETENETYTSVPTILNKLRNSGYIVSHNYIELKDTNTGILKEKISFKDAFLKYVAFTENPFTDFLGFERKLLENTHPIIHDAFHKLKKTRVEELKYDSYYVKRELDRYIDTPINVKIANKIKKKLSLNEPIPKADAKKVLQDIYTYYGLGSRTAKTTDYEKWFNITEKKLTINGNRVECIVLSEKII